MRDKFKNIKSNASISEIIQWIIEVTRYRNFDVDDFNTQITESPRIFSPPASSSDLVGTEKAGDVAADTGFFYVVVDNAGTLEWRRVAISSF